MSEFIRTILIMSISGSIIAILLFAMKPFVRNRLPKSAQYYLWLVVIATLLVPFSKLIVIENNSAMPIPVAPIQSALEQVPITSGDENTLWRNDPARPQTQEEVQRFKKSQNNWLLLPYAHPFIAAAVLLYFIISYSVFMRLRRRRNTTATAQELTVLTELCGNCHAPQLYRNPLAATPMLIGLFRPAIILPDREYTDEQLRAVLLHELTHLRRKDMLVKWLSVLVTALHWFNPIVWLVRHEIDRACELSCDEAVIRNLDTDGKRNYGETLIYVAGGGGSPQPIAPVGAGVLFAEKKALKERLGAIMKSKKHTRLAILVSAVLIITVGGTAIALGAGRAEVLSLPKVDDRPVVTLYGYDFAQDNGDSDEVKRHFTGILQPDLNTGVTLLTDTIFIDVHPPEGAVSEQVFCAIEGEEAILVSSGRWFNPHTHDLETSRQPSGGTFDPVRINPDGFTGSIWAVTTDADGVEHTSDVVPVIWVKPLAESSQTLNANPPKTIDDAVKWYLNNVEADKYLNGQHFISTYRTLDTQETSDSITIYAHILCTWLSAEGESVSGGAGLVSMIFAKDNGVYSYKESMDHIKPTDYDLPQKVLDTLDYSGTSYFADMREEMDKVVADWIREFVRPLPESSETTPPEEYPSTSEIVDGSIIRITDFKTGDHCTLNVEVLTDTGEIYSASGAAIYEAVGNTFLTLPADVLVDYIDYDSSTNRSGKKLLSYLIQGGSYNPEPTIAMLTVHTDDGGNIVELTEIYVP